MVYLYTLLFINLKEKPDIQKVVSLINKLPETERIFLWTCLQHKDGYSLIEKAISDHNKIINENIV